MTEGGLARKAPLPFLPSVICNLSSDTGAVAQLGERLLCKQEVAGSTPVGSMPADR